MARNVGLALAFCAWAWGVSPTAQALPVLDEKDAAVRINVTGTTMNIDSSQPNNLIKWVDFSIQKGETVNFGSKNYLNYVTGSAMSEIMGAINGKGNIYIINPNGILIGDGAQVNVGMLYLSTRDVDKSVLRAFSSKDAIPLAEGNVKGDVVNLGNLKATTVVVEGNVVKFKNCTEQNDADKKIGYVKAESVKISATSETHIGYAGESAPSLPSWEFSGTTSVIEYKLVKDATDLQNMKNNLSRNYMLAGDITADGFQAVGDDGGAYRGHFDGLGYGITLANLKANGSTSGLFGAIGTGSVVEDVSVETNGIEAPTANSDKYVFIGGVVGRNEQGIIRNVRHSGNISNCTAQYESDTIQYVGGIVGYNMNGTVEVVCNTGDISAAKSTGMYVGGIAGYNDKEEKLNSIIQNAYNTGYIKSDTYAGGIVGQNMSGKIGNVYNLGAVKGKWAGGIAGLQNGTSAKISYAYHAQGTVTGSEKSCAIVGDSKGGMISKAVHTKTTKEGFDIEVASGGGERKNDEELMQAGTFSEWDISETGGAGKTWRIYEGKSMPLLTAFLKTRDNIHRLEYDGTMQSGAYWDAELSDKVSTQAEGYDYVRNVLCVAPQNEMVEYDDVMAGDFDENVKRDNYTDVMVALQSRWNESNRLLQAESWMEHKTVFLVGDGVSVPASMDAEELVRILSAATETRENE